MITSNIFSIKLAANQSPVYSVDQTKGIIKYGAKNDYPNYLLWLLNNHAEHGQIVRGKASYVSGLSIRPAKENQAAEQFLLRANPFETWHELSLKKDLDRANFGGYYLKIESGPDGRPLNWYHLLYASVRQTEKGDFKVCDNWKNYYNNKVETFPCFKEGHAGTSIFYYKDYTPSENKIDGTYAKPEFLSCTLDIDTDIRVGTFFNNYIKNNFSSGTMVIIPNGETDPKKQKNIVDRLKQEHTGEDKAGNVVVVFTPKDGNKETQVLSLNANDLDKQYAEVSKRDKEKIVAGHGVTGVLFKIKTDDKALFSRSEIVEAHELFINEYVKPKQKKETNLLSKWFNLKTGQAEEFEIEQVELIGMDAMSSDFRQYLTNDEAREKLGLPKLEVAKSPINDALNSMSPLVTTKVLETMSKDEIRRLAGLPATTIPTTDANGNPIPVQEASVNENLKNLTGRQFQGLMRIVKKYDDKKISKESAMALMKSGFGVSDQEALTFLNVADEDEPALKMAVQQSSQEKNKRIRDLFLKYSHEIQDGEILETFDLKRINFDSTAVLEGRINELRGGILNALKGNPYLTIDDIAKQFGVEVSDIQKQVDWLTEKKLIEGSEGQWQPTPKAMAKETEPFETEIITEYTYELRPGISPPAILVTTRDNCREWYNMTRKKAITYEAIQKLTNEFGDPAFEFAGGFYNNNGEVTSWCRHYWEGKTKIVRKK